MKKILSVILALSMCASVTALSAGTASAATVETQSVSEAMMDISLEEKLDKMSANDTVAVNVSLALGDIDLDIESYAKMNGMEDQLEYDAEGNFKSCSMELLLSCITYYYDLCMDVADIQYEIVKANYCQKILSYDRANATLVCISTKSQVNAMAKSNTASYIELADKIYADVENQFTWAEYERMVDSARAYMSTQTGVQYTESNCSVTYSGFVNDDYVAFNFFGDKMDLTTTAVVKRDNDVVWLEELLDSKALLYKDGKVYTAGELYKQGEFTFEEFKAAGGMYFGDVNGDDIVDVNDVTQLQLYLAGSTSTGSVILDFLMSFQTPFFDVNFDSYVDVNDVTTLQMYLAGYEV